MRRLLVGRGLVGSTPGDAVLVEEGRITALGRLGALPVRGAEVERVQGLIMPGLRDAHIHPVALAAGRAVLDVSQARSMRDLHDLLAAHAARLPPGGPLVARGLDEAHLGRLPTRLDLDRAVGDRPALVSRRCGHVAIASTTALDAAGIDTGHAGPEGGLVERSSDGAPNGILRETAVTAVSAVLGPGLPAPAREEVLATLEGLAGAGVVAIDAMVTLSGGMWCGPADELTVLLDLASELPLRVAVHVITDRAEELTRAAAAIGEAGGLLHFAGWKGFADGSLGGRTAALRSPYADLPSDAGILRLRPVRDLALLRAAADLGGGSAIHAIGDRAVEETLDLFAKARRDGVEAPLRIEHASLLDPALVGRLAELGVVASVQPSFARSDAGWLEERLGRERTRWVYPFRSLLEAGVRVLSGSDAPVEPSDPWATMAAARLHLGPGSEEALDGEEALGLGISGRLEQGAAADLIVVDRDPRTLAPEELSEVTVQAVYLAGNRVVSAARSR